MARAKAAPKAKGGQGNRTKAPRGRAGSRVPKAAPIHTRATVHPARPKSPRHDPSGGHMPEEMVGGFKCKHCGYPGWREHRVVTKEGAHHATLAFAGCTNCGTLHATHVGAAAHANHVNAKTRVRKRSDLTDAEYLDVTKSIDSTETAVIAQEGPESVGHRTGCPRGGDSPCGAEKAGRCTACKWQVEDHRALGKTAIDVVVMDLRKLAGLA